MNTKSDRNIVVLGEDQKTYFKQIEASLKMLGMSAPESVHYSFVLLSDGKQTDGDVLSLKEQKINKKIYKWWIYFG